MTTKERDELLAAADTFHRLLFGKPGTAPPALPVNEPAKVQVGRSCPCGAYKASDVLLIGVQPDGTVSVRHGGVYHVCPPQPKPSMSQAVRELVRAAEATVKRWDSPKWKLEEATAEYIGDLRRTVVAVKELFVEEQE